MLYTRLPLLLDISGNHLHKIDTETYSQYTDITIYPENEIQEYDNVLDVCVMFIVRDTLGNIYKPKDTTPIFEIPLVNSIDKETTFKNGYLNIIGNIMLYITNEGLAIDILETMPTPLGVMEIDNRLVYTFELYLLGVNVQYFKEKYDAEVITSREQLKFTYMAEDLFFKPVIFANQLDKGEQSDEMVK